MVFPCTATILYNITKLLYYASSQYHSCVLLHVQTRRLLSFFTDRTMLLWACQVYITIVYTIICTIKRVNVKVKRKFAICFLLECFRQVNHHFIPAM